MRQSAASGTAGGESWSLEIQIHPSDIRKRVRYLFLTRVQVTVLCICALLYILLLALAVAVAPGVLGGLLNRQEYYSLAGERAQQGERLQDLVRQLGKFQARTQELDVNINKVMLAYALPRSRTPLANPAGPVDPAGSADAAAAPDSIYAGVIQQGDRLRARTREQLRQLDAALARIQAFERESPERVRSTPSVCPLRGELVLTSSFRTRRSPFTKEMAFHPGLDFAAPVGTPIHATADGVVAFAGKYPMSRETEWWRYGNLVALQNGDLFVTLYGHCDEIKVRRGQKVSRGDVLATVGSSGWSASPHVHYEVRRRDAAGEPRPIDPLVYILDRRWPNEEKLLFGGRNAPPPNGYELLPKALGR